METTENKKAEANKIQPRPKKSKSHGQKKPAMHKAKPGTLKIVPLGGLEEIGMNMTVFEYGESAIVIDCGIAFPEEGEPGVDIIIPDAAYLERIAPKIKGFFITHGHEDHIGALPFILQSVNAAVYGTKLTIALIKHKLQMRKMSRGAKLISCGYGHKAAAGDFSVEFIRTNHSIQDSAALAIRCPAGTIVHTGDFKVDLTPVYGDPIDLTRFAEIGKEKVLAMLCDSTNAGLAGSTPSERSVGETLDALFLKYHGRRILIATFASNVDRVQQIINASHRSGRKVAIDGKSMSNIVGIAADLGYIKLPKETLISLEELDRFPKGESVIIMTGSQGEEMASLPRVAKGKHQRIRADKDDVAILSAHPIPGNEKAVHDVVNAFMMGGIEVVQQDVHVSGHARAEDIKLLYSIVKPEYAIPVHGDYMQRAMQANLVRELGYDDSHIQMISSGDALEIGHGYAKVQKGFVPCGRVMVDGNGIGSVGDSVLRERRQLSSDGIVMILMTIDKKTGRMLSGPSIVSRGFVYMRESHDALSIMYQAAGRAVSQYEKGKERKVDLPLLRELVRGAVGRSLWEQMKARPIILPLVTEV